MMTKHILIFTTCLLGLTTYSVNNVSVAQLNNKPFSFNTPGGGVGMSLGGKQAILNREISRATPSNLVRGSDGSLLSITKGKGGSPIVSYEGGSIIPSFRGSSFKGSNESWSAGVFNTFFESHNTNSYSSTYAQVQTGAIISTWTGRVATDLPVSYIADNSVDTWTGMVIQAAYQKPLGSGPINRIP